MWLLVRTRQLPIAIVEIDQFLLAQFKVSISSLGSEEKIMLMTLVSLTYLYHVS